MKKKNIVILLLIILLLLSSCETTTNINEKKVADYNTHINIWDDVPYNSEKSKLEEMNINYKSNSLFSFISFFNAIEGDVYEDTERAIDTYTYFKEIKPGYENDTFTDNAYIIPYLTNETDIAVIVIPGGGYGFKSMDGDTGEGKDIAIELNKRGISAFVLHYRSNPYEYPVRELDLQRAIRFIKENEKTFNINPNKIGLIGFSAGGNLIGTYINQIVGKDYLPNDYIKDDIDLIDDSILSAAMIYPALTYKYNMGMLFASFNAKDLRNEDKREEILKLTNLSQNFNSKDIAQFISYGTNDKLVDSRGTLEYIESAIEHNVNITIVEAVNQNHGYSAKHYIDEYVTWLKNLSK